MGRKRLSNKQNLNLWVDKDLVATIKKLELNSSVLFTEAAQKKLDKMKKQQENTQNDEK